MYQNIGKKIQGIAKVFAWLGIIFSVVFAAVMFFGQSEGEPISMATRIVMGICVLLGGSALAWISSWLVYGFGELIENTKKIADKK